MEGVFLEVNVPARFEKVEGINRLDPPLLNPLNPCGRYYVHWKVRLLKVSQPHLLFNQFV